VRYSILSVVATFVYCEKKEKKEFRVKEALLFGGKKYC
jgi:hypothetical protein